MREEMNLVFLVEQGSYSDYRILAAFSTKARAEEYAAGVGGDAQVAQYPVDEDFDNWYVTEVRMDRQGEVQSVETKIRDQGRVLEFPHFVGNAISGSWQSFQRIEICYESLSRDQTAVIKTANDIRTRILASDLWPEEGSDIRVVYACSEQVRELFQAERDLKMGISTGVES